MKIHIISAALPPKINGIGDYTAQFASAIASSAEATILTALQPPANPLSGVTIKPVFDLTRLRSVSAIADAVYQDQPDWVVLQFEQFFYGPRWGFNPYLPLAIRKIKRECPNVRFALMAHERFVSFETWQTTIMASWQRWQYASLVQSADVVFFSIAIWAEMLQSRQPGKRVVHLPVGSNMPNLCIAKEEAKHQLGLPYDTFVVGLFGAPATKLNMMQWVEDALCAVQNTGRKVLLLYLGPHGERIQSTLSGVPVRIEGRLAAEDVSRRFAAMDAYLVPVAEGVTTRRGTLMAGLQHGVPTVTIYSDLTDSVLMDANESALLMASTKSQEMFAEMLVRIAENADLRAHLRRNAQNLYNSTFSWECIASKFLTELAGVK